MRNGNNLFLRAKNTLLVSFYFSIAILLCFNTVIVSAINDETLDKYASNNIMFYDQDEGKCSTYAVKGDNITYIGDSISVSIYDSIKNEYPGIDGEDKVYDGTTYNLIKVSKVFSGDEDGPNHDGITLVKKLVEKNELRSHLIFALGTNSPGMVTEKVLDDLVAAAGSNTKILLTTNFSIKNNIDLYNKNNDAIRSYAATHDNVSVADWNSAVSGYADKYISDPNSLGVHLTDEGKKAFVTMLKNAIASNWNENVGNNGDNKSYDGQDVWTKGELDRINQNKHVYELVAQEYGIKWQLLATLHSVEHNLFVDNPENGQGLYQLYSYTRKKGTSELDPDKAFLPAGAVTEEEFIRQTRLAADLVVSIINSNKLDLQSDEGAKVVFFQYNGKAKQYIDKALAMGYSQEQANIGEGSPYVMNRFDERRDPTKPDKMDPLWRGKYVADHKYDDQAVSYNFGTFVKYSAIGGMSGSSCTDNSSLISYVRRFVWPEWHAAPFTDRMPDYAEAVKTRQSKGLYVGGSVDGVSGIDCGGFVTTILNESGFAPEYNYYGKISDGASNVGYGQVPYVRSHPEQWELVNPDWNTPIPDESVLSPGDVAYTHCNETNIETSACGHTYLYIGEVDGFQTHIASASYSSNGNAHARAPVSGMEGVIYGLEDDKVTKEIVRWVHRK